MPLSLSDTKTKVEIKKETREGRIVSPYEPENKLVFPQVLALQYFFRKANFLIFKIKF